MKNKDEKTDIIGLDIDSSSVKLAVLSGSKDNIFVVNKLSFHPTNFSDSALEGYRNIWETEGILGKRIHLSLTGPSTIVRFIDFPQMPEEDFKKALQFEGGNYFPFPMEEILVDSKILQPDIGDKKMKVIIVAAKKDLIHKRVEFVRHTGLEVETLQIDSIALVNLYNLLPENSTYVKNPTEAVLYVGDYLSTVNIIEGDIPRLSRQVMVGLDKVKQSFKREFPESTQEEFYQVLKNADPDKNKSLADIFSDSLSKIITELQVSLDYFEYYAESKGSVKRLLLTGIGALIPSLKDRLSETLDMEVVFWPPEGLLSFDQNVASVGDDILQYFSVSLGLCVNNLLK